MLDIVSILEECRLKKIHGEPYNIHESMKTFEHIQGGEQMHMYNLRMDSKERDREG